jgi:hypothetical protein
MRPDKSNNYLKFIQKAIKDELLIDHLLKTIENPGLSEKMLREIEESFSYTITQCMERDSNPRYITKITDFIVCNISLNRPVKRMIEEFSEQLEYEIIMLTAFLSDHHEMDDIFKIAANKEDAAEANQWANAMLYEIPDNFMETSMPFLS